MVGLLEGVMVGDGDGFAEREGFKDGESLGLCD